MSSLFEDQIRNSPCSTTFPCTHLQTSSPPLASHSSERNLPKMKLFSVLSTFRRNLYNFIRDIFFVTVQPLAVRPGYQPTNQTLACCFDAVLFLGGLFYVLPWLILIFVLIFIVHGCSSPLSRRALPIGFCAAPFPIQAHGRSWYKSLWAREVNDPIVSGVPNYISSIMTSAPDFQSKSEEIALLRKRLRNSEWDTTLLVQRLSKLQSSVHRPSVPSLMTLVKPKLKIR